MPWYTRVPATLTALTAPWLRAAPVTNLAVVVSAIRAQRTLTLAQLARAYPHPPTAPGGQCPTTGCTIGASGAGAASTIRGEPRARCKQRASRPWSATC